MESYNYNKLKHFIHNSSSKIPIVNYHVHPDITIEDKAISTKLHIDTSKYRGTIKEDQRGLNNRYDAPIPMNNNTSLNKVLHIEKSLQYNPNKNPDKLLNCEYSVVPGDKPWSGIPLPNEKMAF